MRDLTVGLIQSALAWEQPQQNREHFETLIEHCGNNADLIVLPEMFTTGFSMQAAQQAESMDGTTCDWLRRLARAHDTAIAGSLPIAENGAVYNRLLFATPDGIQHYDKRHLFRMGNEHEHYKPGSARQVVNWRDWRINLQVCYDLRFPVFSRNQNDYDVLLYVANWPARRAQHWRALLPARAIENAAYVVAVNRIGDDGNSVAHSGDSLVIDPRGTTTLDMGSEAGVKTTVLDADALRQWRERFPVYKDADRFEWLT